MPEPEPHAMSGADPQSRVFESEGEIYRVISESRASFYKNLFDNGTIDELVSAGLLIPSAIVREAEDGDLLVLHERVDPVSYPHEWCGEMFRDAALLTLGLQQELLARGLMLKDAHPWNVSFRGSHPVFLDLGSLRVRDRRWHAAWEFTSTFLDVLQMFEAGLGDLARLLLRDNTGQHIRRFGRLVRGSSSHSELSGALKRLIPASVRASVRRILSAGEKRDADSTDLEAQTRRLHDQVAGFAFRDVQTAWSSYNDDDFPDPSDPASWTLKERSTVNVLQRLAPPTLLDVGSNRGWFTQFAARNGARACGVDADEPAITKLYLDSKRDGLQVLPLMIDLRDPSPGLGIMNRAMAPALDRLPADTVLAISLVHHLVFKGQWRFEQIADTMARLTRRALVIEFIPREDAYVAKWWKPKYEWYTQDNFERALRRHFSSVESFPSAPDPRVILLCLKD